MTRTLPAVLVILSGAATLAAAEGTRPNVVLIVADDLGYGDLGCYGSKVHRTPHIDALAASGAWFTQFRVNPLCAPTRASLLTGLYSLQTGMWRGPSRGGAGEDADEASAPRRPRRERRERPEGEEADGHARALHAELRLLPQSLKEAGYATGMFGKWHLGYASPNVPNERGFDEFVGFLGGAHPYDSSRGEPIQRNGTPIKDERHLTDLFTDEAVAFIESHRSEPFFCYVPYNAVHGPLWSSSRMSPSGTTDWLRRAEERGLDFPVRDYAAVLEQMDAGVGRITEALRRLDLEERTLILFVSDNGALEEQYPGDNGPLRGQKGQTYEGGVRVPAIASWAGVIPAGGTSGEAAHVFDFYSTILDAAGIEVPKTNGGRDVHGVSLLPHLRSGETLPDRYLFWDLYGKVGAFHDGWKLVAELENHRGRFTEALPGIQAAQFELYYLPDDLAEEHDLASEKPEVYDDLKRRFIEWFQNASRQRP